MEHGPLAPRDRPPTGTPRRRPRPRPRSLERTRPSCASAPCRASATVSSATRFASSNSAHLVVARPSARRSRRGRSTARMRRSARLAGARVEGERAPVLGDRAVDLERQGVAARRALTPPGVVGVAGRDRLGRRGRVGTGGRRRVRRSVRGAAAPAASRDGERRGMPERHAATVRRAGPTSRARGTSASSRTSGCPRGRPAPRPRRRRGSRARGGRSRAAICHSGGVSTTMRRNMMSGDMPGIIDIVTARGRRAPRGRRESTPWRG